MSLFRPNVLIRVPKGQHRPKLVGETEPFTSTGKAESGEMFSTWTVKDEKHYFQFSLSQQELEKALERIKSFGKEKK